MDPAHHWLTFSVKLPKIYMKKLGCKMANLPAMTNGEPTKGAWAASDAAEFCFTFGLCDTYFPTLGLQINKHLFQCIPGIPEKVKLAAKMMDGVAMAVSPTSNLVKSVRVFIGGDDADKWVREVAVHGNFYAMGGIVFPTDSVLPGNIAKYVEIKAIAYRMLDLGGNWAQSAGKLRDASNFEDVLTTLTTQFQYLQNGRVELALKLKSLTGKALPDIDIELASCTQLMTTRLDTDYKPGIYLFATGADMISTIISNIVDIVVDSFGYLLDKIFGCSGCGAT